MAETKTKAAADSGTIKTSTAENDPTFNSKRAPEGGTVQDEPKPEDMPSDAKITPIAAQINTSAEQAVGGAAIPQQRDADLQSSLEEAETTRQENVAKALDVKADKTSA